MAIQLQQLSNAQHSQFVAEAALTSVAIQLRREFIASTEYQMAVNRLATAQRNYTASNLAMLKQLSQQPEYRALTEAKVKARRAVDEAAASAAASPAQVAELARAALAASAAVSNLERKTSDASIELQRAKVELNDAHRSLQAMKAEFEKSIRSTAEYESAKRAVTAASAQTAEARRTLTTLSNGGSARAR